jgi:hypothetical protein
MIGNVKLFMYIFIENKSYIILLSIFPIAEGDELKPMDYILRLLTGRYTRAVERQM